MVILNLEKITETFFGAPEIQAKLGQRLLPGVSLDTSFEKITYITIFGDGASLISDKDGSVNIMAAFRNGAFAKQLLGKAKYDKEVRRKGEAAGWQHTEIIHNIGWGNVADDGLHNYALGVDNMAYAKILHKQGFHYDKKTGVTFAVRVAVSNDLKAMGLWYGRGGASSSADNCCLWNEMHM